MSVLNSLEITFSDCLLSLFFRDCVTYFKDFGHKVIISPFDHMIWMSKDLLIQTISYLDPAIEYYTHKNIRRSSYISLSVNNTTVQTIILFLVLLFFSFVPSQHRSVYSLTNKICTFHLSQDSFILLLMALLCMLVSLLLHMYTFKFSSVSFWRGEGIFSTFNPCLHHLLSFFHWVMHCSMSWFACWLITWIKLWFLFCFPYLFEWFITW